MTILHTIPNGSQAPRHTYPAPPTVDLLDRIGRLARALVAAPGDDVVLRQLRALCTGPCLDETIGR